MVDKLEIKIVDSIEGTDWYSKHDIEIIVNIFHEVIPFIKKEVDVINEEVVLLKEARSSLGLEKANLAYWFGRLGIAPVRMNGSEDMNDWEYRVDDFNKVLKAKNESRYELLKTRHLNDYKKKKVKLLEPKPKGIVEKFIINLLTG